MVVAIGTYGSLIKDAELEGIEERLSLLEEEKEKEQLKKGRELRKSIIKRLRKIEQRTFQPRWRAVTKDYDGLYLGECGDGLGQEQFDAWVKQQDKDTQVIIVEVCENIPTAIGEKESVTLKVENNRDKNTSDLPKI